MEIQNQMIDFRKRKARTVDEGVAKRSKINHFIPQVDGNDDDDAPGLVCKYCYIVFTKKKFSLQDTWKVVKKLRWTITQLMVGKTTAKKKTFFCEQCKKSYARLDTLQKHCCEQHKMQKSGPSYPTSKNINCQTPKDDDWTIGNFDIAKLTKSESELKEGKENLYFDDSDSDAEVRFGKG